MTGIISEGASLDLYLYNNPRIRQTQWVNCLRQDRFFGGSYKSNVRQS